MCLFIFNFLPFLCLFSSIMPYFYVIFYGMVNTTGISLLNCFSSDDSAFIPFAVATTEELLLLQAHFQLSMRYEIRTKMILEAEPCFLLFLSRACSGFFFFFYFSQDNYRNFKSSASIYMSFPPSLPQGTMEPRLTIKTSHDL